MGARGDEALGWPQQLVMLRSGKFTIVNLSDITQGLTTARPGDRALRTNKNAPRSPSISIPLNGIAAEHGGLKEETEMKRRWRRDKKIDWILKES